LEAATVSDPHVAGKVPALPLLPPCANFLFDCAFSMEMAWLGMLVDRSVRVVESVVIARK
jgi:hypothetical protein